MPRSHNSIIQRNLMIMIISKLWTVPNSLVISTLQR